MRYMLFLLSIACCGAVSWHLYEESLASVESKPKPKPASVSAVDVVRVTRRPINERIELVGSLEPIAEVEIRSRVSGYLQGLPFDIGDSVDRSQTVVELDAAATRELVVRATAAEQVAAAQLKAQVARENQARRGVERLRELADSGVSTAQQIEEAESVLLVASAETELERARLSQAKADLERSRLALNELRIPTPISGFVAELNVDVGDLARAEDVLMRIVDLSVIRAVVNIVERDYGKIRLGQAAIIKVDGLPDQEFSGTVVRKAPILDPTTRTAQVIIEVENPNILLNPGMHGRVVIVVARQTDALVVPASAVHDRDGVRFLYTVDVDRKTARQRAVTIGIRDGNNVQVLTGIDENALVVTLGGRLIKHDSAIEFAELPGFAPAAGISSVRNEDSAAAAE